MRLSDVLNVGEICEVSGRKVKAGVYVNKNAEYLNYEGNIIKSVGIGTFVIIKKGFTNIVGKVDGEYMKDLKIEDYSFSKEVKRFVSIDILGIIKKDIFIAGLTELPTIGNNVYIATDTIKKTILNCNNKHSIKLGKLIQDFDYPFEIDAQKLMCSHIGIFGNTGSGKSNTLAKIYNEIIEKYKNNLSFRENSHFCVFDFNGEYKNVFDNAKYYNFSTKEKYEDNSNKYHLNIDDIQSVDFWSLIFNATEKTQKPFIKRCISLYKKVINNDYCIDTKKISEIITNLNANYNDCKYYIKTIFELLNITESYDVLEDILFANGNSNNLYILDDNGNSKYQVNTSMIENKIFGEYRIFDLSNLNSFSKFELTLLINYCMEIGKAYISKEHIGPMMSRSQNKIKEISSIFSISANNKVESGIEVFYLGDLSIEYRKMVPMIICKKLYDEKKKNSKNRVKKSLHIIVDEAHNILSTESVRESEEWKDYRLEVFEEIVKEGRKFSTFLTISSQRPSDISDTIISQLHNYFIHRLVNDEDLRKIRKSVSFIDGETNDMIPILPSGGCIFSGIASNYPILAQINILPKEKQPLSETIDIDKCWVDE